MPAVPDSSPEAPRRTASTRRSRLLERQAQERARTQRRRVIVSATAVVALLIAGSGMLDRLSDQRLGGAALPAPTSSPATSPTPAPSPSPEPSPEPTEPPVVLALPGDFATSGPGSVAIADGGTEVVGDAGILRRYRVAVETVIDGELAEFTELVEETLADEQGWTAGGDYRFQRVADGAGHDFTIYLVTSRTAEQMCAAGGLVIIAPDLPDGGVSCRLSGEVIINYSRWRESVPHFVAAEVPLLAYRQMLLNHEVGHELGWGHFGCPGGGEPAPVMQQQSIDLAGCEANSWPYLDGAHHTGPPVA